MLLLQLEPASRLKSATRDVSFLRSYSRCRRNVTSDLSNVTTRYLGSEQNGRISLLYLTFSSRLTSLLRWKAADTVFVVLSFSFQVWRYLPEQGDGNRNRENSADFQCFIFQFGALEHLYTKRAVESENRHPTPTPGNFDYPTQTPTPGRLRPSAVLVT